MVKLFSQDDAFHVFSVDFGADVASYLHRLYLTFVIEVDGASRAICPYVDGEPPPRT